MENMKLNPPPYDDVMEENRYKASVAPPPEPPHSAPVTQNVHLQLGRGVGMLSVGPNRQFVECPNCGVSVKTKTSTDHKCCSHCLCLLMFCTGIGLLCSCLPYCICSPKRVQHICPNCKHLVGVYYG